MRLWHKYLIPVLPRMQLLGQWRELCLIAKEIDHNGTPGHLLVNAVMAYPIEHLVVYADLVAGEMRRREYKVNYMKFDRYIPGLRVGYCPSKAELYADWHDERYLVQCFFNLQEKYDCGGIPENEWRFLLESLPQRLVKTLEYGYCNSIRKEDYAWLETM